MLFGNTKQVTQDYDTVLDNSIPFRKNDLLRITYFRIPVIQDYDTVFDDSILFRKNDLLRITYFRIQDVTGLHFVPWHRGSGCLRT